MSDVDKESEKLGGGEELFASFEDYQQVHPEEARIVISYKSYALLTSHDHELFWDEQVYDNLKKALDADNPTIHPGVRLYFFDQQRKHYAETALRVPGSTAEYAYAAATKIPGLETELETWKKTQPEEYDKAKELIEAIQAGKLKQFDHERLIQILRSSIYHFPGIALSYQIRKAQEDLEEFTQKKVSELPPRPRSGKSAMERYQEYLKQQELKPEEQQD